DMLASLKEFLLLYGLLNKILLIPRECIIYNLRGKGTLLNTIQGLLEDITALEWDWWPLSPRMRLLRYYKIQVY
ncbi:uncharacterized protein K441DRAFT_597048, partial [Cenococcum geophilum 1.58]